MWKYQLSLVNTPSNDHPYQLHISNTDQWIFFTLRSNIVLFVFNLPGWISVVAKGVPYMNTVLCLVLVVMITIHIITMMSCGSRAKRQIQRILTDSRLMASEAYSLDGCISDLILVTAVANENPNWSGGMTKELRKQPTQKDVYLVFLVSL